MPAPWHTHKSKGVRSSAFSICLPDCCPDSWGPAPPVPGKAELWCLVSEPGRPPHRCSARQDTAACPCSKRCWHLFTFFFLFQRWRNRANLVVLWRVQWIPKALFLPYKCCRFLHPCFKIRASWFLKLCHKFSPSSPGAYKPCLLNTSMVIFQTGHCLSWLRCLILLIYFFFFFPLFSHPPCWKLGGWVLAVSGLAIFLLVMESLKENILWVKPCKCLTKTKQPQEQAVCVAAEQILCRKCTA